MKATIPNGDPDNPDNTKDASPLELDLDGWVETPSDEAKPFQEAIAKAAAQQHVEPGNADRKAKLRHAKALAEERINAAREAVKAETGVAIGFDNLRAFIPKPKAAYGLWKRVVPLLIQNPELLDLKVVQLARWLDATEPNYVVTRDMLYDPLNDLAVHDLVRLLDRLDTKLVLKKKVTIASVRKHLIELRKAKSAEQAQEFSLHFTVREGTVHVNGKAYVIQKGSSGKDRIKLGRSWLALDAVRQLAKTE